MGERPLRTLIVSVLFAKPVKVSKKCEIDELKQAAGEMATPIDDEQLGDVQHAIQNVINVDRSVYLPLAFSFGKECLTQKHVELRQPFQRVAEDIWARLDGLKDQIKAHPYAHVLEPLIAQCGFNMMANAEAHAAVLNDLLNLVEDKKSSDPDWMPALVELLVSLFVDESHKTRTLVLGCFRQRPTWSPTPVSTSPWPLTPQSSRPRRPTTRCSPSARSPTPASSPPTSSSTGAQLASRSASTTSHPRSSPAVTWPRSNAPSACCPTRLRSPKPGLVLITSSISCTPSVPLSTGMSEKAWRRASSPRPARILPLLRRITKRSASTPLTVKTKAKKSTR